jgi:hypothetical protein
MEATELVTFAVVTVTLVIGLVSLFSGGMELLAIVRATATLDTLASTSCGERFGLPPRIRRSACQ